ncbi:hypothetical protein [Limobrevibacterium gyesilva]|nr:hypothetical protein [Limobrevibacterium gyesilva]
MVLGLILASQAFAVVLDPPIPSSRDAQSKHQDAAADHHYDPQDTQRGTRATPIVVEIHQPEHQRPIATQTEKEGEWYASPDWWVAGFTGALFFATVGLWVFTGMLWNTTKKAVRDGELAVAAATTAAKAAVKQADVAEQTAEKQLRAYLCLSPASMIVVKPGEELTCSISITNQGATPASNGIVVFGFSVCRPLGDNDYYVPIENVIISKSPIILAANSQPYPLVLKDGTPLSGLNFMRIQSGDNIIVIAGVVRYKDIFGIERYTCFNYSYNWDQMLKVDDMIVKDGFVGAQGPATFSMCGNDMD